MSKEKVSRSEVDAYFEKLELTMVRYKDLIDIPVIESNQDFTQVKDPRIVSQFLPQFRDASFGDSILVREEVAKRLVVGKNILETDRPDLRLRLTFGYRSLAVQQQRFGVVAEKTKAEKPLLSPEELIEEIHRYVAVPEVAGHPTGGAVDVVLIDGNGEIVDFGSPIYDYRTKDCYYDNPFIPEKAMANRKVLRHSMLAAGFAPFDGEYWHFCFGDREWAFYYSQPRAIYSQKTVEEIQIMP